MWHQYVASKFNGSVRPLFFEPALVVMVYRRYFQTRQRQDRRKCNQILIFTIQLYSAQTTIRNRVIDSIPPEQALVSGCPPELNYTSAVQEACHTRYRLMPHIPALMTTRRHTKLWDTKRRTPVCQGGVREEANIIHTRKIHRHSSPARATHRAKTCTSPQHAPHTHRNAYTAKQRTQHQNATNQDAAMRTQNNPKFFILMLRWWGGLWGTTFLSMTT